MENANCSAFNWEEEPKFGCTLLDGQGVCLHGNGTILKDLRIKSSSKSSDPSRTYLKVTLKTETENFQKVGDTTSFDNFPPLCSRKFHLRSPFLSIHGDTMLVDIFVIIYI